MPTDTKMEDYVAQKRAELGEIVASLFTFRDALGDGVSIPVLETENRSEVLANVSIAIRAAEDARMRLGKVFEHREGKSNAVR